MSQRKEPNTRFRNGNKFTKLLIAFALFGIIAISANLPEATSLPAPSPSVVPAGIVYSVPITLTNTQLVATPTPFQQMVAVSSVSFSSHEATNLQNMEFFDSSGNIIPSWLESGNSASSTHTIYWLLIASGIPASSSITIYMGFASSATNLFNSQTTGEAPQLSSTYGQFDDGNTVFDFYDNFAGTSLNTNLWTLHGTAYTVNNKLTFTTGEGWTSVVSINSFNPETQVNDFYGYFTTLTTNPAWKNFGFTSGQNIYVVTEDAPTVTDYALFNNHGTTQWVNLGSASLSSSSVFSVWTSTSSDYASINYGTTVGNAGGTFITSCPVVIGEYGSDSGSLIAQWTRVRAQPPNGVMPTVDINGVETLYSPSATTSPTSIPLPSATPFTIPATTPSPTTSSKSIPTINVPETTPTFPNSNPSNLSLNLEIIIAIVGVVAGVVTAIAVPLWLEKRKEVKERLKEVERKKRAEEIEQKETGLCEEIEKATSIDELKVLKDKAIMLVERHEIRKAYYEVAKTRITERKEELSSKSKP